MLEIGLRVSGRVFRRAQPLKPLHRGTPARGVAGSNHRGRQTVRCRGVVRLGRHRGAKRVERLGILPLFEVQLSKVHRRAGIGRIHPLHPCERLERIISTILVACDQAKQVIGLRAIGQRGPDRFDFAASRVGITAIEERDPEIEACDPEVSIDVQRLPERRRSGSKVVLLQVGDADVVGAIGILAARRRRPGRRLERM